MTDLLVLIAAIIAVARIFIKTELDWSTTSVFKDFVHIYLGFLICEAYRLKSKLLWFTLVAITVWEVICVLMFRGA